MDLILSCCWKGQYHFSYATCRNFVARERVDHWFVFFEDCVSRNEIFLFGTKNRYSSSLQPQSGCVRYKDKRVGTCRGGWEAVECLVLFWWCSSCYTNSPSSHPHRFLCQNAAAVVLLKVSHYCYRNVCFWFLQTGTCAGSSSNYFKF